jgi:phage terminase large subunit-like protein
MTKKKKTSPSPQSKAARQVRPPSKPPAHPHVALMLEYCRDIIDGTIPAAKLTQQACQRHLDDLKRAAAEDVGFPYYFDPEQAERVCRFVEMLPHVKGKWARKDPLNPKSNRIRLEPWQCFFLCSIFGWMMTGTERALPSKRVVGLRRFAEVDLWVARKNAKSTLAAGIGHWMFAKDEEPGAEVYCGAGSEKQAWEVFGPARQMCVSEPKLKADLGITINAKSLIRQSGGNLSKFEPVIGKPGDGASPSCAIIDEYHEHATSEQYDTFKTGMGAREQPILLIISTAGNNSAAPARDQWRDGEKILQRVIENERRFVLIYTVDDPEEEWKTEHGLRMANPNWGISVNRVKYLSDLAEALRDAKKQSAFKTKHANIWVTVSQAYFNLENWTRCKSPAPLHVESFKQQVCYAGGDFASKVNLAAVAKCFPLTGGRFAFFCRYYAPLATVQLSQNRHLWGWAQEKWLTTTPGNIIDFDVIRDDILDDCSTFKVKEIAVDPWQATWMITQLRAKRANAFEFRQIVSMMSEPMKQFDALMRDGKLLHDGNPITAWCLSNVKGQEDKKENVYPYKERDVEFIDGAIAMLMAFGRAHVNAGPAGSIYEGRGVRTL